MAHWRHPCEQPSREMVLWSRCVTVLAGVLIGGGLALLVWGLA